MGDKYMRDRYEQSNTNNISGNVFNSPLILIL